MSLGDFIFPCAERTSLSSYGELPLDTCELAACPHIHTHTHKHVSVCIVRSHESLKSATDDISCCWLHIGSGGGAGRHGGQFSGTCNTGLPLPIFFLRSVCLSIFIFFLPSVRTLSSGFLTLLFLEKGKEPAAIEKKYSSDYQTCSQQQQQYEQL